MKEKRFPFTRYRIHLEEMKGEDHAMPCIETEKRNTGRRRIKKGEGEKEKGKKKRN